MANISIDNSKLAADDVAHYMQMFQQARDADDIHRRRGIRNLMAYAGINNGMLTEKMVSDLRLEGREPQSYNFVQVIVRGHVGGYIMNAIDPKFMDREDDNVDAMNATAALQKKYYSEKERHSYKTSAIKAFEQGLLYRGVEEICIDKPSNDPRSFGIRFDPIRFDHIIFDPDNLTDETAKNSRKCWKISFLSSQQLIRLFPKKAKDIIDRRGDTKNKPVQYDQKKINTFLNLDGIKRFGDNHQTIEFFHIEEEKVTRQFYQDIPLPATEFSINSPEHIATQMDWAMRHGFTINSEDVYTIDDYLPKLWLTTFVPDLGLVLQDALDERQFGKYLPFSDFSFMVQAGIPIGLVDFIYDPNLDLNKREAAKTKQITQSPIQKMWMSEDIIPEGSDKKLTDYVSEANDCSKPFVTPAGVPGNTLFGITQGAQINQGLLQDINEKIEFINRIGSLPPAMQGIPGNSAESGIAVGRRVIEGSVMQRLQMENWIDHEHHKAFLWVKLAVQLFGGPANINRAFKMPDGGRVVLNEFMGYDEDGREVIKNNIADLKAIDVMIVESKENDFLKQAQREMDVASLTAIPASPTNDPIRAVFETSLAKRMDFTDEEEKELTLKACEVRMALAMAAAQAQIATFQGQIAAAQTQVVASQQQTNMMQTPPTPASPESLQLPSGPTGGAPAVIPGTETQAKAQANEQRMSAPPVERGA